MADRYEGRRETTEEVVVRMTFYHSFRGRLIQLFLSLGPNPSGGLVMLLGLLLVCPLLLQSENTPSAITTFTGFSSYPCYATMTIFIAPEISCQEFVISKWLRILINGNGYPFAFFVPYKTSTEFSMNCIVSNVIDASHLYFQ